MTALTRAEGNAAAPQFPSREEIGRRYRNVRASMQARQLDALLVCGNQYAGFEGAVRYLSGFEIVHRYVYLLLPLEGDPALVFPREARWIGDKSTPWVREHQWPDVPGRWIRERAAERNWRRLGVYGMDAVMAVRDYRELAAAPFEVVSFDVEFDMARAVKSGEELRAIRHAMEIIVEGFWALVAAYQPGKTEAEIMAPAVERFFARGAGHGMMNIVLSGPGGEAEAHFKVPRNRVVQPGDLMLYSLEITGPEGYWVEFSRPLIRGPLGPMSARMARVYPEALEAARRLMRDGESIASVHKACADAFAAAGFRLGHLSGHSLGMTMIEYPGIGAAGEAVLREDMVLSMHPQVVDAEGRFCFYTQDTYRVGKTEGENLAAVPWKIFAGGERP
ncbi:MAG TPA: M24 family metallopeptidase [Candidatus Acidoferrales bacterium]|nr:M24 family metallopeptidase [Candidatus Acidoferrales bacterium]